MPRHQLLVASVVVMTIAEVALAGTDARDARCVRLDSRMAELQLKLRMGYTARQGRVYRQKLASLETERRQLCR